MRWMIVAFILIIASCHTEEKETVVTYDFIPFYFGKIYLEKLSVNEEPLLVLDSAVIDYKTTHLEFVIPPQEESVFQLRIPGKPLRIYFINDTRKINIKGSSTDPKDYSFENDGGNPSFKVYLDRQKKINEEITSIIENAGNGSSPTLQTALLKQTDSLKAVYENNARLFADTTSSAGAFLFAYNSVDFGPDRQGLKKYIDNAAKRFPEHKNIQVLKNDVLDYISIYEEEFEVGTEIPKLHLPGINAISVPVLPLKGKYVFIDLWSTWCPPCLAFNAHKKDIAKKFPAGKLALVSIAIDAEKDSWKNMIAQQQLPGTHFIDEKMWRGKAARTWKFDSIPFNYLLSPDGKIIAKAISSDSLMSVLTKFVQ